MSHRFIRSLFIVALCAATLPPSTAHAQTLGIFEGQSDVGIVTPPGAGTYDPTTSTYTITSAGANLWGTTDAFHYLWKKASGDLTLTADIDFPDTTGEHNPHRKANHDAPDQQKLPSPPDIGDIAKGHTAPDLGEQ